MSKNHSTATPQPAGAITVDDEPHAVWRTTDTPFEGAEEMLRVLGRMREFTKLTEAPKDLIVSFIIAHAPTLKPKREALGAMAGFALLAIMTEVQTTIAVPLAAAPTTAHQRNGTRTKTTSSTPTPSAQPSRTGTGGRTATLTGSRSARRSSTSGGSKDSEQLRI